jgi:hypothetical protein
MAGVFYGLLRARSIDQRTTNGRPTEKWWVRRRNAQRHQKQARRHTASPTGGPQHALAQYSLTTLETLYIYVSEVTTVEVARC